MRVGEKRDAVGAPQPLQLLFRPHLSPEARGRRLDALSARAFELVGYLFAIPQPTADLQKQMLIELAELTGEYSIVGESD